MEDRQSSNSTAASTTRQNRYERLGHLFEIGAVLLIAASAVTVLLSQFTPLIVLATVGFVAAFVCIYFAIAFASKSGAEAVRAADEVRYAITRRRIKTIEILEDAPDAIEVLEKIKDDPEVVKQEGRLKEKDLVSRLIAELGSERVSEIKGVILKYTRIDKSDLSEASS